MKSLLEIAQENTATNYRLSKFHKLGEEDVIDLLLAYASCKISVSGVKAALKTRGYITAEGKGGNVLTVLGGKIFRLAREGKIKITKV